MRSSFTSSKRFITVMACAALAAGCWDYNASPPPSPPAAPAAGAAAPRADAPAPAQPGASTPPANTTGPATGAATSSSATRVQLSAGTALPQTLPDGTMLGFEAEYQFAQGTPEISSQLRYFWVIERRQGPPQKLPVRLKARGFLTETVAAPPFLPWKVEEGPFQSHLEDSGGQSISNAIPMVVAGQ